MRFSNNITIRVHPLRAAGIVGHWGFVGDANDVPFNWPTRLHSNASIIRKIGRQGEKWYITGHPLYVAKTFSTSSIDAEKIMDAIWRAARAGCTTASLIRTDLYTSEQANSKSIEDYYAEAGTHGNLAATAVRAAEKRQRIHITFSILAA